jgi:hypothetical protein
MPAPKVALSDSFSSTINQTWPTLPVVVVVVLPGAVDVGVGVGVAVAAAVADGVAEAVAAGVGVAFTVAVGVAPAATDALGDGVEPPPTGIAGFGPTAAPPAHAASEKTATQRKSGRDNADVTIQPRVQGKEDGEGPAYLMGRPLEASTTVTIFS